MGRRGHGQRLPTRPSQVNHDGVYTARPDWTFAAESAWSRIAKFQWLNRLGSQELAFALGAHAQVPGSEGIDLRCGQGFDAAKMAATLQVSHSRIMQSFCVARRSDTLIDFCSRTLRFCPSCIRRAYHATFFQLRFVRRCPLHREPLIRVCPHCHATIPYRLDRFLVQRPYACGSCDQALHAVRRAQHARAVQSDLSPTDNELLDGWQRYFAVAVTLHLGARIERARSPRGLFVAVHADASAESINRRFAFLRDLQETYRQAPPLPTDMETLDIASLPCDLAIDTKEDARSYGRHFASRWPHLPEDYAWYARTYFNTLRRFRRRISPIDPHCWRTKRRSRTRLLDEHHDPDAIALTGWQLSWEGTARTAVPRRRMPLLGLLEWWAFAPIRPSAITLPVWRIALRRWFKRDLQRLFEYWVDFARWMKKQHVFLVNRQFLSPGILWLNLDCPWRMVQVSNLSGSV